MFFSPVINALVNNKMTNILDKYLNVNYNKLKMYRMNLNT